MLTTVRVLAAIACLASATPATSQELRIGLATEPTSIDPQFFNSAPNIALARQIFDGLINYGPNLELLPALATSWKPVGDGLTWEIQLRQGVKFHNGADFTADDVLCSFARVQGETELYKAFSRAFASTLSGKVFSSPDKYTVLVRSPVKNPLIAADLAPIAILPKDVGCNQSTASFNDGKLVVGTGPYRFVEYAKGDRIVLAANDNYWGERPSWRRVTLRPITAAGPRAAALLAGDVDLIEAVPTDVVSVLRKDSRVEVFQRPTNRVIHVILDQFRDDSPFVKGTNGEAIKNPLRDPRVRLALSKAIDRTAIVAKTMDGFAVAAGQLQPDGFFGYTPSLTALPVDVEGAKRLLAEAGVGGGFRLTLHGPSDRYQNDARILEDLAQMWAKIGVRTEVVAMPVAAYTPLQSGGNSAIPGFSASLLGVASTANGGLNQLRLMIAGFDGARGFGNFNYGRYLNRDADRLIDEALQTDDPAIREALTIKATELAMKDVAVIPLHFQVASWAARKGIEYTPQASEFTLATAARAR